jgi:hypothetical protein
LDSKEIKPQGACPIFSGFLLVTSGWKKRYYRRWPGDEPCIKT